MTHTEAPTARPCTAHAVIYLTETGCSMCEALAILAPAAPDHAEFIVCSDCAIVLVNGDTSGIEDAEAHLAAMDAELAGYGPVIVTGDPDGGFRTETCGACGTYTATDEWRDAIIEIIAK